MSYPRFTQSALPPTKEPEAPPPVPAPESVRDFNDLLGRGIAVVTAFYEKYPADYARLRSGHRGFGSGPFGGAR